MSRRKTSNSRGRKSSRSASPADRNRSRSNNGVVVTVTKLTTGRYLVSTKYEIVKETVRGRRSGRRSVHWSSNEARVGVVEEGEVYAKGYATFVKSQLANRKITMVRLYAIRLLIITDI